jgi:DNA-binding transcriptional LysR family regulator
MNLDLINDFLAIARAGNLSAAAVQRNANHSTIYRRLHLLEEQLNCRLFERLHDGYQLTPAGEELLVHAQRIEQEADAAERILAGKDTSLQGEVRVTAPENIAYEYLPAYLEQFHKIHPQIRVSVIVSNSDLDLNRREADIAIRATKQPPDYLVGRRVLSLSWFIYGNSKYLRRAGKISTIKDINNFDWIGPDPGLLYIAAFNWFHKNVRDEQIVSRASTLNAMAKQAETGMGLVVLPVDQVDKKLTKLMAFTPGDGSDLWLLTHPDLRFSGRIKALMEFLTNAFTGEKRLIG